MSSLIPGSLETQTREPLDGKYWIQSFNNIDLGLTFQGLMRFDKSTNKLWIKLTQGWTEVPTTASLNGNLSVTVGAVTRGAAGSSPVITNSGTASNAILDFTIPTGDTGATPIIDIGTVVNGLAPNVTNVGTIDRAILNFVIPSGSDGQSLWIAYSKYSTGQNATFTLNIAHKFISILSSTTQPDLNAFTTWVKFVGDPGGPAGDSAYMTWLANGNTGTEAQFLASLKGTNGASAYQSWLALGNVGTEQDFINSLQGSGGGISYIIGAGLTLNGTTLTADVTLSVTNGLNNRVTVLETVNNSLFIAKSLVTGQVLGYSTVQAAINSLSTSGGGIVTCNADMLTPVTITGNVSLEGKNYSIIVNSGANVDALTLNSHTGFINLKSITRNGAGTGYPLICQQSSNSVVTANVYGNVSYNAIFCYNANLDYTGNVLLETQDSSIGSGEVIAVLSYGNSRLTTRGTIKLNTNRAVAECIVAGLSPSTFFDCFSLVTVANKGYIGRCQAANFNIYSPIVSNDKGFKFVNAGGICNIYSSIDLRKSTDVNKVPLILGLNNTDPTTYAITLWPGSSLLTSGTTAISNSNSSVNQVLRVVGSLLTLGGIDSNITVQYITPQAAAAAFSPQLFIDNYDQGSSNTTASILGGKLTLNGAGGTGGTYTLPTASTTILGGIKVGNGLSIASSVLSVIPVTTKTSTVLTFDVDAEYTSIASGTYTLDASTKVVGVCVRVSLLVGTTAITIPTSGYQKMTTAIFDPAKENIYSFCVGANNTIQYYINQPQ